MNLITVNDLAGLVRQTRTARGWTQAKLADHAGVSRDWIIGLEKAKPTLELALVLRTLKALDLSLTIGGHPRVASSENTINLDDLLELNSNVEGDERI